MTNSKQRSVLINIVLFVVFTFVKQGFLKKNYFYTILYNSEHE